MVMSANVAYVKSVEDLAQTLWNYHAIGDSLEKVDVIVGLGSYDLRVVDRCVWLYNKQMAPLILFTGNVGNWTQGKWKQTEAETFGQRAVHLNVPRKDILLECRATNIGENLRFTKQVLATSGTKLKSAILVTKPNTKRRVWATIPKEWPEIQAMVDSPDLTFEEFPTAERSREDLINEMVGDTQRMKLYADRGLQVEQAIPDDVWSAYLQLREMRFTEHLLS